MATSKALKQLVFESYNGMNRPAMFWGIPIMPMIVLLMSGLTLGVAGTALLSWIWGLVFVAPFLITLLALRFLCAMDGQYLRRVRFARRRIALNLKYGKPLLLTLRIPIGAGSMATAFHNNVMPVGEKIPLLKYPVDEHIYTLEGDRAVSVIRLKGISHETRDDDELIDFFNQLNRYFVALGKKEGKNLMIQT